MVPRLDAARELDARLKDLVKAARAAEAEVAYALLEMKRRGLFRFLGYSRMQDYAEVELDVSKEKAKALVEVAARAEDLPKVRVRGRRDPVDEGAAGRPHRHARDRAALAG